MKIHPQTELPMRARKPRRSSASQGDQTLVARDQAVLHFLADTGEAASGVLREAVFPGGRSPTPLFRSIRRLSIRGLVSATREHAFAEMRLRLSVRGVAFLIDIGRDPDSIFRLTRTAARQEWPHRDYVGRLLVAVSRLDPRPDLLIPYWSMERRLEPRPSVVPDLLVLWRPAAELPGAALIIEVDFGGESLRRILAPKLDILFSFARDLGEANVSMLMLLNRDSRRRAVERLVSRLAVSISVRTSLLPESGCDHGIAALFALCDDAVRSGAHLGVSQLTDPKHFADPPIPRSASSPGLKGRKKGECI